MTLRKLFSVRSADGGVASTSINLEQVAKVLSGFRPKEPAGGRGFFCNVTLTTGEVIEAPDEPAAREMYYALFNEPAESGVSRFTQVSESPPKPRPLDDERFFKQV